MRLVAGLVLVISALTGCSADAVSSAGDCSVMVRFEGREYVGHWFTDEPAAALGEAELAECDDVGDGAGQVFPDDVTLVEVRALDGFDSSKVVVVALPDYASWHVMLAEDTPDDVRARLDAALG